MSPAPAPKYIVIDDFLRPELLAAVDAHCRTSDRSMELAEFGGAPEEGHYAAARKMWVSNEGLGPLEPSFRAAVLNSLDEICARTGISRFEVAHVETQVCAQQAGSFFRKHIDTDTRDVRAGTSTDRIISAVYYFPREPLGFSGGELLLYDFTAKEESARIQPRRNRLVAFPSFAHHEVTRVTGSDNWETARWSINCWLHRARPGAAAG